MIHRATDAELVNRLSNDPAIRPYVAFHDGPVDWTPALSSEDVLLLTNGEDACMVLWRTAPRDWQCTTIFGKTCRGARAVKTGLAIRDYMFPRLADLVFGSIPSDFLHAVWFYKKLGGIEARYVDSGNELYVPEDGRRLFKLEAGTW